MLKHLLIVLSYVVAICSAQDGIIQSSARGKPYKHHHHQLYYLTHYWIFLAIKAKIIFLIGTFISVWLFAGKAFAFLYYIKNKESCRCPEVHSEKIVVSDEPHFEHKYSTIHNSGPPLDFYLPYGSKPYFSPYEKYSRSIENSTFANVDFLKSLIKKVDLTELAFGAMKLKRKSCKMRFVCEAEQQTKNNSLLAFSLYMFSDVGFTKYRSNKKILSIKDCISLGPHCSVISN